MVTHCPYSTVTRVRWPHDQAFLAAAYAYTGADKEARIAASRLMEVARSEMKSAAALFPEIWLSFVAEKIPYRDKADLDHLLDGLRKVGLPE